MTKQESAYKFLTVAALWGIVVALGFVAFDGSTESSEPFVFNYPVTQAPPVNGVDGKDGLDGTNGRDGVDGVDGKDGERGRDGLPAPTKVDGVIIEYQGEKE